MKVLLVHSFGWQVRVSNNCVHNQYKALAERHIKDRTYIGFDKKVFRKATRAPFEKLWQATSFDKVGIASLQDVVESYVGGKRKMYAAAKEKVENSSFNRKWAKVRMFVKPDKRDICEIWDKTPRAIQYRRPEFNIMMAQYLRPLEEKLFNWVDDKGLRSFAKCRNLQQRASDIIKIYDSFENPVILSTDHAKFDSCVTVDHLKLVHKFYLKVHPSRSLFKLLRFQINNSGFSVNGIRYKVKGTRMSGDYDTSLGNCLLNYFVMHAWLDLCGIVGHVYIDGDDALVFMNKSDVWKIDENTFKTLGFETELAVGDLESFEFCQAKLIRSNPPTLARDPRKVISNLQVSLRNYTANYWPKLLQGKIICEYWANQGVPYVCRTMLNMLHKKLEYRIPPEDMRRWTMVKDHVKAKVTPQAHADLLRAWNFGHSEASLFMTPYAWSNPTLCKSGPATRSKYEWTRRSLHRIQATSRWLALTCGPRCGPNCRGAREEVVEPAVCETEPIITNTTTKKPGGNFPRSRQAAQPSESSGLGSQNIRLRDLEAFAIADDKKGKLMTWVFCPGKFGVTRLDNFGTMYSQYQIHSVSIAWKSEASTTTDGTVTYGIRPGPANQKITDKGTILKLRPFKSHAVWKSDSITVGRQVMQQPWLYCNGIADDNAAFTLYAVASNNSGYFQITYDLTLRYPHP